MVNEEIKYIKNTIKTFIGLKKKFDLRIMFLVFFPLRVFLCIPLIYETIKLLYFKICGYNILLTCFKGKKNKNSGLNEGWNRLCCLFKKTTNICWQTGITIAYLNRWTRDFLFSNHTRYIPDKSKYMLHLSFSTLTSTMELQNYNGPTSIVCEPLPSVRPSNTLWQSVFGTLFANFVNCNGTLKIYWNVLVRHDMHCLSWWTNKYLSFYTIRKRLNQNIRKLKIYSVIDAVTKSKRQNKIAVSAMQMRRQRSHFRLGRYIWRNIDYFGHIYIIFIY